MHGNQLCTIEVRDFWMYLRTASNIASEILPDEPPTTSLAPHFALQQEYELVNMLYYMSRSVSIITF